MNKAASSAVSAQRARRGSTASAQRALAGDVVVSRPDGNGSVGCMMAWRSEVRSVPASHRQTLESFSTKQVRPSTAGSAAEPGRSLAGAARRRPRWPRELTLPAVG